MKKLKLKDGRKIWRTDNGFTYWVEDKKGRAQQVTEEYYNKAKKHVV